MDFLALSQECAPWVAPQTMAAIVKTESGFNPLSIGVNGGNRLVRQPDTKDEAVATAKWLIEKGHNIDLGLGQVNSSNLSKVRLSIEDAFEPCKNIAAAATILHGNYKAAKNRGHDDQAALHASLSAYNTGSFSKGFSNGYVQKVIRNAEGVTSNPKAAIATPIHLVSTKQDSKLRSNPNQPLKLKPSSVESASENTGTSVYNSGTAGVMVYR